MGEDTVVGLPRPGGTVEENPLLRVLLGPDAPGPATTIRRLVAAWQDEHQRWQRRDLTGKRYLYVWADGVYFAPRLEHERQCVLILIGADAGGKTANVLNYLPKSVQSTRRSSTLPAHRRCCAE